KRVAALEEVMQILQKNPGHNELVPLGAIEGLHFGRLVLLPEAQDLEGRTIEPQLLMLTDFDGSVEKHRQALVSKWGPGFDAVFGHCVGYPAAPAWAEGRLAFLRAHSVRTPANYIHRPGRTVEQIRSEATLREAIEEFLDRSNQPIENVSALETRERVRA